MKRLGRGQLTDPLQLLEAAADPALIVNGEGRVEWFNRAAARFFGFAAQPPRHLQQLLPASDVRAVLETRYLSVFNSEIKMAGGAPLRQHVSVLDVSGGDPGAAAFLIMFFSAAPASGHLLQKEYFLESAAHDLKNPLGAIFGYADALLDTGAGAGLTKTQQEVVARIRSTALRSIELVKNYQYLLEAQSQPVIPSTQRLDLNSVVRSVVGYLWREEALGPQVRLELDAGELLVRVKRPQLERVFANLFSNALNYTPEKGFVTVTSWHDDLTVFLKIVNHPAVIDAEELLHIFSRYQRGSNAGDVSGSGLGLYIVKQIMDGVGGTISASSDAEQGTCFTLSFPRHTLG